MDKKAFLEGLSNRLSGLPKAELEERLAFYAEMIDDRVEEGLSEQEAVADIGTVDEVAERIIAETPLTKLIKERVKPARRLKPGEILLLVLGSPVWVPLMIAAFAVLFSFYVAIWAIVVSVFAVLAAFALSAVGCLGLAIALAIYGQWAKAGLALAAALLLAGLAILWFFVCKGTAKAAVWLTKKTAYGVKTLFVGKK